MRENRIASAYAENGARDTSQVQCHEGQRSETERPPEHHHQLITCRLDELRRHPSYIRHHLAVSASKLSALAQQGERAFFEPLVITRDRTILDGYDRWELAQLQERASLPCIVFDLSESEALQWLLQKHRRSSGLNDFSRILLAFELEPWFRENARSNQRVGGLNKRSSNLTEAGRLDVRIEVALAAGVSVGNVTKVKQLMLTADSELMKALREGEISIHRAWLWCKESPERQREELRLHQSTRGTKQTIRLLVSRHRSKNLPVVPNFDTLIRQMSALDTSRSGPVSITVVKAPGRTIFLTEQLFQALESQQELSLTCASNIR